MGVFAAKQLIIAFSLREYVRQMPDMASTVGQGEAGAMRKMTHYLSPYSFGVVASMCYEQMADHGAGYHHES